MEINLETCDCKINAKPQVVHPKRRAWSKIGYVICVKIDNEGQIMMNVEPVYQSAFPFDIQYSISAII